MNMDLKWEKQIAKLGSMVGRYRHIAEKNNLSPAQTTTLFNIYLKTKLEYRMQFIDIPKEKLEQWDKDLQRTLSDKISKHHPVKREALRMTTGLQIPSRYYQYSHLAGLEKGLNEDSHMGFTTRAKMKPVPGKSNRVTDRMKLAKRLGFTIIPNPHADRDVPNQITQDTTWKQTRIEGLDTMLPDAACGLWGGGRKNQRRHDLLGRVTTRER